LLDKPQLTAPFSFKAAKLALQLGAQHLRVGLPAFAARITWPKNQPDSVSLPFR
jgi:hypothetical protein